jgi:hypothetical protein
MRKRWMWLLGIVAGLIIVVIALSFFIDEPLRRYAEEAINARLEGYTVRVGNLDLHPWRFAVDVSEVTIAQDVHPEPPIVHVPRLHAGLHWRALLSGRVVGEIRVERPQVYLNLQQIRKEAEDEVPLQEKGWQEALTEVMPLEINVLEMVEGTVTYIDEKPAEPVHLTQLNMRAENIRNIRTPEDEFPSTLQLESTVFGLGKIELDGRADFLAEPHPAVKAQLRLEHVELGYVKPIASRYNVFIADGTLSGAGEMTYTSASRVVHLHQATLEGLHMDYVYTGGPAPVNAEEAKEAAEEVTETPALILRADEVNIVKSDVGFMNSAAEPNYRVFLTKLEMQLTNFSNQLSEGVTFVRLTGQFMGSGQTVVGATFKPETRGPAFGLAARIENTQMQDMNDLLLAHGDFDVEAGLFSLYAELQVQDEAVKGYVKPLFREVEVFDPNQDKGFFQTLYEGLVAGAMELLENVPREEVATRVDLSGPLADPNVSTWEALVNLIRNAFFEAILPGFEEQLKRAKR